MEHRPRKYAPSPLPLRHHQTREQEVTAVVAFGQPTTQPTATSLQSSQREGYLAASRGSPPKELFPGMQVCLRQLKRFPCTRLRRTGQTKERKQGSKQRQHAKKKGDIKWACCVRKGGPESRLRKMRVINRAELRHDFFHFFNLTLQIYLYRYKRVYVFLLS